jgi:hypothetical protein
VIKILSANKKITGDQARRRLLARLLCSVLAFFFFVFPAAAQSEVAAILEYCDYPDQVKITDSDGFEVQTPYFGMDLGKGDSIKTGNSAAEIRLTRNGSIIRLAPHTDFRIDTLEGAEGDADNRFSLVSGKLRSVASSTARGKYEIHTPTAVCEARETDFAVSVVAGSLDAIAVRAGRATVTKKATGEIIFIETGKAADTFAGTFQPEVYSAEKIEEIFYDLEFVMFDPIVLVQPSPQEPVQSIQAPEYHEEGPEYGSYDWFAGLLREHVAVGAELGAVTINKKTYSKFVVQPRLAIGGFKLGLYFPLMFSGDPLSPSDEYHPLGNDEWDFGKHASNRSSSSDAGRKNFLRDLVLKIHFAEYGKPGDAVFLNAGSFRDISIGHGSLMFKYANDTDFPAARRLGVHIGADAGIAGFEAMTADLAEADIAAGRVFLRPIPSFPLSFGFSAAVDKHPVFAMSDSIKAAFPLPSLGDDYRDIDPMLLGFALDTDLRLWKSDSASATFFADLSTLMPYLRHEYGGARKSGLLSDAFYDNDEGKFRNYGLSGGVFGNFSALDYRLEYRQYQGIFRPGLFGPNYDHFRSFSAINLLQYLNDPNNSRYSVTTLAFYGELGFTLFEKLYLSAGALLPSEKDGKGYDYSDNDYAELRLRMMKGFIPVPVLDRLSFTFEYTREMFAPFVRDLVHGRPADFVDAYTVLKGEIAYFVSDSVDIAFSVATVARRDAEGFIIYNADYQPRWTYAYVIETRIRF